MNRVIKRSYCIVHIAAVTVAEYECKFEPTKDTANLAIMGEQWGVFCDVEKIDGVLTALHCT